MEDKNFIIYKSSAGSGKTYTLTMEYLKLALKFPDSFKSILAVTFTNKATAEMKERILKELKRLKHTVQPDQKMDRELLDGLNIGEDELKSRATKVLTAILHDYGRFSVSTIDSFFQKVVRSFAREMDLNAKFEVEMDQDAVLDRVVDRVVAKVMDDEFLHKWLVDYAVEQIQNGKSWDIRKNIKELGKQIFQEDFKKYGNEIREFLKEKENIKNLNAFVRERKAELIKVTRQLKEEANQIRINNGLEWTDFSGATVSFAKKFDLLGDRYNPVPELSPTQVDKIGNPESWYKKKDPNMERIESAYHQGLNLILSQFDTLLTKWNTLEAISKNIFVFGIFRNLLEELTLLKDEESILLISDANEFLKEITKENDAPFIYEKVGNQYRNYLIDEFQDTSGFQWASFKPLLENSLSQGNINLLVGDVKQSIYRWRGGEMKLLLEQVESEIGAQRVRNENLDTNFRSLPNIINFNNALFKQLPKAFEEVVERVYSASDAGIISRAYHDVHQKVSDRKANLESKGKVRFEFIDVKESEEEGKFDAQALSRLPRIVMELQDKGYELRDIAFLVRRKSEGEAIADTLMGFGADNPELPYSFDVLSDESMYLQKSASVKALVAGLHYLHEPEDKVQFKTMWYYYSVLKNEAVNHDLFALEKTPEYLVKKEKSFKEKETILLQLPLMEAVEELIGELELQQNGLEKAYISGFKEAVYDFTANNRADLSGFLEWWEENKEKRTVKIPEGHNAMRILTIHKSKGLQFKVVLMPFLKWEIFDTRKGNVVWSPFQDSEWNLSAIIPLTLNGKLAKSDFNETYSEEATLAYLDSLNMIYVALTRAEEVIWGLVPFKEIKKDPSLNNLEIHLQKVLSGFIDNDRELSLSEYFDPDTKVFDYGSWPKTETKKKEEKDMPQLRWAYQNWSELLKVKQYAVDFSAEGIAQRKKQNFGLLVHEILEKSGTLTECQSILQAFYYEGRISEEERLQVESQLQGLFADPLFASWFDTEGVLLAEQGILLPGGKQKRPDRIILKDSEALIVDFKTGEAYEKYKNQVREYMDLVGKLAAKPVRGFICYLETGEIVKINA
ncbi:UvrD-helicase domain-containing protein [Cognataquiflexum rubidum]|uniref:UvrD-helicase domain-containing protein n=1 Tax=Cognataquiflexum rubidum TaxID=2922273 RepID=UPI001F148CF8|nr:UvrD-helicase domain-containing protein [Cognataquiflexum rubidum]MCH6232985.1 UvrD-helicase domain-containing protein [Cognataquiflexum rubidum]